MTELERLKVKIEAVGHEPSPAQMMALIEDIVGIIDNKEKIGFKNEGK